MKKMKPSISKFLSYALLAIMVSFIVLYVRDHPEISNKIKILDITTTVVTSFFIILFFLLNGYRTKILTQFFFKEKLHAREWLGLSMINTVGNYSPFQGGIMARGYYLKRYYKISFSHFLSSMVVSTIITFSTFSLLITLSIFLIYLQKNIFYGFAFFLFSGIFTTLALLITCAPRIHLKKIKENKLTSYIKSFGEGWGIISSESYYIRKLIFLDLILAVTLTLRFFYIAQKLNLEIGFFESLAISLSSTFSLILNVTPGALGIRELLAGFIAQLLGNQAIDAALVTGIESAITVALVLTLGIPFSYYYVRLLEKK